MRIGILTFHRGPNDGTVMQAYCSQEFLKYHCPDADIEIIDCIPKKLYMRLIREHLTKKIPFINFSRWKRLKQVRAFCSEFYQLSPKTIITDDLQKASRFIEDLEYDVICVGSDTVWRIVENENTATAPNIYFLPGDKAVKKIAFAVSCDSTDEELFKEETRMRKIKECVEDFDYIGIRDLTTLDYLKQFGIRQERINTLPDPTILWDFTGIVKDPVETEYLKKNRIAGVSTTCQVHKEKVSSYLNNKGYVVYNLMGAPAKGAMGISTANSLVQRLGFYRFLDLLVTDRFHGSLFSFKLSDNAPVVFLETKERYPNVPSKGRDLFRKMGIENMVIRLSNKDIDTGLLDQTIMDWPCKGDEIQRRLRLQREDACYSVAKMLSVINSAKLLKQQV